MELFLKAPDYINIDEISNFEKYAVKRFNVSCVELKIKTENLEETKAPPIKEEWKNLITYFSNKNPMARAFLKNSEMDLDKDINIHIKVKGKEILEKQNVNTKISECIKNIYGMNYKINFVEEGVEDYEIF